MALYFANSYGHEISIAFAWFDSGCGAKNQDFRKQGWWNLESGETFLAWDVDLSSVNQYAYFYAEAADGAVWSDTLNNAWLYIRQAHFDQCAFDTAPGDQQVDFNELDFKGFSDWTVGIGSTPGLWVAIGARLVG